jgi:transcriptional regulator with XRE-family HTH domain
MISSKQCKAGRAVHNWTQSDLSDESGVSLRTIQEFEADKRTPNKTTLQGLLAALERNGVVLGKDGASLSWAFRGITIDPRKVGRGADLE